MASATDNNQVMQWHKIAESFLEIERVKGNPWQVRVAGRDMCIVVHNGEGYGCSAKCPHAGGIMANGHINGLGQIVCPLHQYRFDLRNGRNVSGEGYFLKTYPVKETDDGVFVGL